MNTPLRTYDEKLQCSMTSVSECSFNAQVWLISVNCTAPLTGANSARPAVVRRESQQDYFRKKSREILFDVEGGAEKECEELARPQRSVAEERLPCWKALPGGRPAGPTHLCRNSWKTTRLGKPWRQIRMPSRTPLQRSWSSTRWGSSLPD